MLLLSSEKKKKLEAIKDLELNELVKMVNEFKSKSDLIENISEKELKSLIDNHLEDNKLAIQKEIVEEEKKILDQLEIEKTHEEILTWASTNEKRRIQNKKDVKSIKKGEIPEWYEKLPVDSNCSYGIKPTYDGSALKGFTKTEKKKPKLIETDVRLISGKSFNFARYGDSDKTHLIEDDRLRDIAKNIDDMYHNKSDIFLKSFKLPPKITKKDIIDAKLLGLKKLIQERIEQKIKDIGKSYSDIIIKDKDKSASKVVDELIERMIK